MNKARSIETALSAPRGWSLDRLFEAAKKDTVIRLRWPLVILSSYLLYYIPNDWFTPAQVQAVLILYLLSHSTLYFLSDGLFDSPYFYGPLMVFDTAVLAVVLSASGTASPDFYVACLLTLVLSLICNDPRGLFVVTFLAPLIYGYAVFYSAEGFDPSLYLRLPFPFMISLFYGYFAQVERIRRGAREKEQQVKIQQKAAEEIRCQRERLEVLHHVNLSVTLTNDTGRIIDGFLQTSLVHLPYAAAILRLKNSATGAIETAAARGVKSKKLAQSAQALELTDHVLESEKPLTIKNAFTDGRIRGLEFFKDEGLVSLVGVPLLANQQALGCLVFLAREEHEFGEEEVDFLSTLAGQVAVAIHHAELYSRSRRQAEELRDAHKIKDEFLKVVSTELKTPLNVIAGYSDMFLQGLLGALTPIQERAMETVARQSKELHGLIDTVLQASAIEAEKPQVELRDINLWEFMSEIKSSYEGRAAPHVRLIWEYPSDVPLLLVDRAKLRHILENLIGNALKFTERGSVTVGARYIDASHLLEFKIADTGAGIPAEQRAEIFERFRQVQDTKAWTDHRGVGLGLYIVKRYVDLIGGKIYVDSRLGEGSTFVLHVPAPLAKADTGHEQLPLISTRFLS
jgi:signal transduction histidine kinase